MSTATSFLWDKISPINGVGIERLKEKFTGEDGTTDRVLIAYDGVISRIQRVNDQEFTADEKAHMQNLIQNGVDRNQAIADTWLLKVQNEERAAQEQANAEKAKSNEQLKADIDYIAAMTGVDLDV